MVQVRKRRRGELLSALDVKRANAAGLYADGLNLNLQVGKEGGKSWIFRYKVAGEETWLGVGPLHTVSLAEARKRAQAMRLQLLDGIDPKQHRDAARRELRLAAGRRITFDEAARQYIESRSVKWKNKKHCDQWANTIRDYASPVFGSMQVRDIDHTLVLKVIEPLWTTKNETAMRLLGRLARIFAWAKARKYCEGDNPARWTDHLKELLPEVSRTARIVHHASAPYAEVPALVQEIRALEGIAARALEFTILTAARTIETIGAKWDEFDLKEKAWTVPASRMKMGRAHWSPLAPPVVALVADLPKLSDEFVFFGSHHNKPISNAAMAAVLKRIGRADITVHGFRSSFRTWCDEKTDYETAVAEFALAHGIEDKTQQAYRRGRFEEKRRKLAAEWARYCLTAPADGRVIDIRAARK